MPILTAEERVGTTIGGRYRLERVIGRGGMATVLEGTHAMNGRKVAVKLLNPELSTDADVVARFVQEARAAAALDHPNVVSVLDTGQDADGTPFLVLELLRGETLAQCLKRQGRLSLDETLTVLLPVLDALAAAHAHGIVHRDLKPDNVFLALDATGRMTPKLLDFGIARVAEGSRSHTATGVALGTPYYMSPEQVDAPSTVGPASDVWSMGVVLYQCLTGTLPFQGATPSSVLVAIMTTPPPSVASRGLGIAPAITAVVDRALSRDPAGRFASARELAEALVAAAHGERGAMPPRRGMGRGGAFVVLTLAVTVVGAGIALAYFYANGRLPELLGVSQPVAVRPVVVGGDAGTPLAPAIDAGTPSAASPADAGVVAVASMDAGPAHEALPDGGLFAALDRAFPDGAVMPGMGRLTPAQRAAFFHFVEEMAPHGTRPSPRERTTDSPLLQAAHACPHGDDTCLVAVLREHAMSEPELSTLIDALHRQNRLREAAVPLARYLELFPDSPRRPEYRRLLARAGSGPRHR